MSFHELAPLSGRALSAVCLVGGAVLLSAGIARRLAPGLGLAARGCALFVVGMWLATLAFHGLLALEWFTLGAAWAALGLALVVARAGGVVGRDTVAGLAHDLRGWARVGRVLLRSRWRLAYAMLGLFALATLVRLLLLPVLGWDSMTYHAVKAALWVQEAGPIALVAPGGWGAHRLRLGGGEVFTAWAMLSMRSDLLAAFVDGAQWCGLGVALYALGRELGLRGRHRVLAALFVLFVPAVFRALGAGYVDNGLALALTAGLVFGVRFAHRRDGPSLVLAGMAFGVALGIKLTALPIAGLVGVVLAACVLAPRADPRRGRAWVAAAVAALALAYGPWVWRAVAATGRPLSPEPVVVAGIALGTDPSASFAWYTQRAELAPYTWQAELGALSDVLATPPGEGAPLGPVTALPLLIALPALAVRTRRDLAAAALLIAVAVGVLVTFYSPGFSVVRLQWAGVNGRFMLPLACIAILASLRHGAHFRTARSVYALVLAGGVGWHVAYHGVRGWAPHELVYVSAGTAAALAAAWAVRAVARRTRGFAAPAVAAAALGAAGLVAADAVHAHTRYAALRGSTAIHWFPRYWVGAAEALDEDAGRRHRIAVTSGPHQNADNWFMYCFLGRRLQNELTYVSITPDGRVPDFAPGKEPAADFDAWLARVRAAGVTEIVSFQPPSAELRWMRSRPDLFDRLDGDGRSWGIYRVRAARARSRTRSPRRRHAGDTPRRTRPSRARATPRSMISRALSRSKCQSGYAKRARARHARCSLSKAQTSMLHTYTPSASARV